MIAILRGSIRARQEGSLLLEVQGVGYLVHTSDKTLATLRDAKETTLFTHYQIRQDIPTLYGFAEEAERAAFLLLLTVPRVGPKVALAILSALSREQLSAAIAAEDTLALSAVSGVSTKLAQKIMVELRDRFPRVEMNGQPRSLVVDAEVVDALVSLGYGVVEAQRAVQGIPADAPEDVSERLRIALGRMGSRE